jgi:hypothetical protein
MAGGTHLSSFCADEVFDANACPIAPGETPCGYVSGQTPQQNPRLLNESVPVEVSGNKYIDCEKVYLHHATSSKNTLFNNTFNVPPGKGSAPDIKWYQQTKPNKPCN